MQVRPLLRPHPTRRPRHAPFALLAATLALLTPGFAHAAQFRHEHIVVIGPDEVINDDLYVAGGEIDIRGHINGDVVAAGGKIRINGEVTGDLITAGGNTVVTGVVGGSMRSAGGSIKLSGTVNHDVVVAGGEFALGQGGQVGRDLVLGTGSSDLDGKVTRNAWLAGSRVVMGGEVGGNVNATVSRLELTDAAVLDGDLSFASRKSFKRAPGATVRGQVTQSPYRYGHRGERSLVAHFVFGMMRWARSVVGWTAFGLLFLLPFPGRAQGVVATLAATPGKSLGVGTILAIAVPFAATIVFIMGILIGGWWIGTTALFLLGVLFAIGYAAAGYFGGQWLAARMGSPGLHRGVALALGIVVLALIVRVPFLGCLFGVIAALFGAGAVALTVFRPGPGVVSSHASG